MNRVWPERLAASFTRSRFGCKGCQRCVWPFACPGVIPSCRSLFSITSFPSATSSIIWSGPTPIRDAANCGCPSFVAPIGDQPMDADGPHRFRNVPFGRDVVQAPGGASGLSHSETRCAAFAGAGASSASTTCRFRESIPHPVQPLSTLQTPRYRDARKTRSRPACSALNGPDFHWQAHSSFPLARRVAQPFLAFAPTDPIVRLSRNGLFRRVTRGHARAPNQRWWITGFGRGKTVRSRSNHSQVRFAL